MQNRLYQVFISSTYTDLIDERRHVAQAISKIGNIPAGMEDFPATSMEQFEYIKRVIDRCDYYILLIAGRYGSISDDGTSFTEREYKYAVSKGIPVLVFLYKDIQNIPHSKVERDEDKFHKLQKFRNDVSNGRIVDYWEDPKELPSKVVYALTQAINLTPGTGWVRGDQAIDPQIYQENEKLRQRIYDLEAQDRPLEFKFPSNLDPIESELHILYAIKKLRIKNPNQNASLVSNENTSYKTTWQDFFKIISQKLLTPKTKELLSSSLGEELIKIKPLLSEEGIQYELEIESDNLQKILDMYILYGLITSMETRHDRAPSSFMRGGTYYLTHYVMTDLGKKFKAYLNVK